jgi:hypothetical protein
MNVAIRDYLFTHTAFDTIIFFHLIMYFILHDIIHKLDIYKSQSHMTDNSVWEDCPGKENGNLKAGAAEATLRSLMRVQRLGVDRMNVLSPNLGS